jgi:hypothetical protein
MEKITVFLNNFNRLTYLKNMVEFLKQFTECDIIVIDNNSTYPALLDWYDKQTICKIIKLNQNMGCMAPWESGIINSMSSHYYIVSDSDMDLSNLPKDFIYQLKIGIDKHPERYKCALSLEYEDIVPTDNYRCAMIETEKRWWQTKIDDLYYICESDTTFAMYRKDIPCPWFTCAIRIDRPYTIKHLPWYLDINNLSEEDKYYLNSASCQPRYSSFAGWIKI